MLAVQGLGGLGHLAIQYANKMGYHVVALSTSSSKEKFARDLGAADFITADEGHASTLQKKFGGAALIVSTAPNPAAMGELQAGLEPLGKLLLLSPAGEVKVDSVGLVVKGQTVCGWPSGHARDSEEALEFAEKEGVKCLVQTWKLGEANEAFEAMTGGKVRFRAVLVVE